MKMHNSVAVRDLSIFWWLILPVIVTLAPYVLALTTDIDVQILHGEFGIVENATVILLGFAIYFTARVLFLQQIRNHNVLRIWLMLFLIGCIYFVGEELSWGQHYLGWDTPEGWREFNDQSETNLHNTSALLDQLPRLLLSLAALIGGALYPLYRRLSGNEFAPSSLYYWIWPTIVCVPVGFLILFLSVHEELYILLGYEIPTMLDIPRGELKEALIALFLMIYIASFRTRLRNLGPAFNIKGLRQA